MADKPEADLVTVRVWDLPTRLFHWALVVCVVVSFVSGHVGGSALVWHMRSGFVIFALLAFRILWGLVGGRWSRFASFVYAPGSVLRYLRRGSRPDEHHDVGHNPLGALSVFALIAIFAAQVATGLFADDEIATTGPLNRFVASATGLALTAWHKGWGQWLMVALVVLHVGAILWYRFGRRIDLVRPMLTGDKALPAGVPASNDGAGARAFAALLLVLCAAGVAWLVALGG